MRSVETVMSGRTARRRAQLLLELQRGVAAPHQRQDAIRAALHRQVQVVDQLARVRKGLDQRVVEIQRMRSGEADALHARHGADRADELARDPSAPAPSRAPS